MYALQKEKMRLVVKLNYEMNMRSQHSKGYFQKA